MIKPWADLEEMRGARTNGGRTLSLSLDDNFVLQVCKKLRN